MSLIFGINLCDRIYISADTRLTHKNREGKVLGYKDNLMKVEILSNDIALAAAGSADMASFLIKKLIKTDLTKYDIREAREKITAIITPFVDEYWKTKRSNASVCFIFGGLNRKDIKSLSASDVYEKIRHFSENDKDKSQMNAKPALFNVLVEKRYPEPIDSDLFSLEIYPPNSFIITDTKWGEYLAFGPRGINKESLPAITLGKLEFETKSRDDGSIDNTIITALITTVAAEKQEQSIGGAVTTILLNEKVTGLLTGKIQSFHPITNVAEHVSETLVIAGTFYRKDSRGTIYKMKNLQEFKSFGNLEMEI